MLFTSFVIHGVQCYSPRLWVICVVIFFIGLHIKLRISYIILVLKYFNFQGYISSFINIIEHINGGTVKEILCVISSYANE